MLVRRSHSRVCDVSFSQLQLADTLILAQDTPSLARSRTSSKCPQDLLHGPQHRTSAVSNHCYRLEAARQQMETNFWGVCRTMLAVLPGMRARRSGVIVNVSSTAGLRVLPTYSHYSASKHAVEAISEGIAQEVAAFGIRVQLVEPGAFRTNFLGKDNIQYAPVSEDYKGSVCDKWLEKLRDMDGKQAGDPEVAAQRIYEAVTGTGMAAGRPPGLRLPLGSDCIQTVGQKLDRVRINFKEWEDVAASTNSRS